MHHRTMASALATVTLLATLACSGAEPAAEREWTGPGPRPDDVRVGDEWEVERSTEGNVTTVRTVSGSRWGGVATLEEELSIGIEAGEDPYMFGRVPGIWATEDRIYVVDYSVPAVRMFDHEGEHLGDVGGPGQGPGEYMRPYSIAVGLDGTVWLTDAQRRNTVIAYSVDGEYLDMWSFQSTISGPPRLVVTHDGIPYMEAMDYEGELRPPIDQDKLRRGVMPMGPGTGDEMLPYPEVDYERPTLSYQGPNGERDRSIPFVPGPAQAFAPSGAFVYGVGTEYRFHIEYPDGSRTVVERYWDPVPVDPDEYESYEAYTTASIRSYHPGWSWNGPAMPEHKPAFTAFYPGKSGRILVVRRGPGERRDPGECTENPTPQDFVDARENRGESVVGCWEATYIWDVFDVEGDYLGELQRPDVDFSGIPFLDGDRMVAAIVDDLGVIRVKKYRIVPPGG